jgi:hypothetical protein
LIDKIDRLDEELENSLSKNQLIKKDGLEKLSKGLEIATKGTSEYRMIEIQVNKAKTDLIKTFRSNQLEIYKKLEASLALYRMKHKTTSIVLSILGGLAGGILLSKISK